MPKLSAHPSSASPTAGDDDNEDSWIPLRTTTSSSAGAGAGTDTKSNEQPYEHKSSSSSSSSSSTTTKAMMVQRRLETRISLKENLVDHPINYFWKRYLINTCKEIFQLELTKRLGLIMIVCGICLKVFLLSTCYFWYPKFALSIVTLILTVWFMDPLDFKQQIHHFGTIFLRPENAANAIEQLNMVQLRRLSYCLILLPTILEVRTISFLSQVHAEFAWNLYNTVLAVSIFSWTTLYQLKLNFVTPRDCIYQGLLILYGSALLVSIIQCDRGRMTILAGPFLTATGTLMITYHNNGDDNDEWVSRLLRHSLRLTLRDVLSSVSQKVSTDEMLQLTILRWIADYWAHSSNDTPPNVTTAAGETETAKDNPKTQQETKTNFSSTPATTETQTSTTSTQMIISRPKKSQNRLAPLTQYHQHQVQWEELLPMLNVAADHMTIEVNQLQQQQQQQQDSDNDAVNSLRTMLLSLNVDERAKPAVLQYRKAVERFPPPRTTAALVSVIKRCPALLALLWHLVIVGSDSIYSSLVLLLPIIVLEYFRIRSWTNSVCIQIDGSSFLHQDDTRGSILSQISRVLDEAGAMTILLSGDNHSFARPPTLLLVWNNILGSVSALEFGLTAAKCVQTTTVAVDFAGNIMSLLNLGLEVKRHGLLHGVGVMTKEFLILQQDHLNNNTAAGGWDQRRTATKYTSAAMGAVHNAQVFATNVKTLVQEEDIDPVLQPIVWTLSKVSGHGWLWGKDDVDNSNSSNSRDSEENLDHHSDDKKKEVAAQKEESIASEPKTQQKQEFTAPESSVSNPGRIEDLATVMEMVAQAFEQGLIDQEEKDTFCSKVSSLSESELFDPSVLEGMKRSLRIILQNGQSTTGRLSGIATKNVSRPVNFPVKAEPVKEETNLGTKDIEHDNPDAGEEESNKEENNDTWIRLGLATLGVVVGGILLNQKGEGITTSDHAATEKNPCEEGDEKSRNASSTVEIEELSDDGDDEWITISDTNTNS